MNRRIVASPLLLAALVGCEPAAHDLELEPARTEAAASVFHERWTGHGASLFFGDALVGGYVDVFQTSTGATLGYHTYEHDPTSEVCVTESYPEGDVTWCRYTRGVFRHGWGPVAAGDAVFKTGSARLDTAVASSATFFAQRCVFDELSPDPAPCTDDAGVIQAVWAADGLASYFHNGVEQATFGIYSFRTNGQYRSESAVADGAVMGLPFADAQAHLSRSQGTRVLKDFVPTP